MESKIEKLPVKVIEEVFGGRYPPEEFGNGAYVIKASKLDPPSNPILISTAGSAGDLGDSKEDPSKYFLQTREHGRALGVYTKERTDLPIVHLTGGCPAIPYELAHEAKSVNPALFSMAFLPRLKTEDSRKIKEGILPYYAGFYDWIVITNLSAMKRGDNVGRADIVIMHHGGSGTLAEGASAYEYGRVIASVPYGKKFGITQVMEETLMYSYADKGSVIFKESDSEKVIKRAMSEYFANEARKSGIKLSNLDIYFKPEEQAYFINARESPRVTTSFYSHLDIKNQMVFGGMDKQELLEYFRHHSKLNGQLKEMRLRNGEYPHMFKGPKDLDGIIQSSIFLMKDPSNLSLHLKLISHNSEVTYQ